MSEKWNKLGKIGLDIYKLEPHMPQRRCGIRVNILHACFDSTEERLFAIDSKGAGYLLEFITNEWTSKKLGFIGQSSFVAFNPKEKYEIIVGLASSDIKIVKLNNHEVLEDLCLLQGHELSPTWISFYKNYCLTASRKEAIVWDLESCLKIHQLQLENNESCIRKAALSSLGHVAALYKNDTIQAWRFNQFEFDSQVCLSDHGLRNVKDFIFTDNGRALITCGAKGRIIVLDTTSWSVITSLDLLESSSGPRRLAIVPLSLDIGSNKVISILFDDGNVKFLDLNAKSFLEASEQLLVGIRKLIVSPQGQWIASIPFDGSLIISSFHRLMSLKTETLRIKTERSRPKAHHVDQHLKCIQRSMKESLRLSKLLPILKEFGEYPERHRIIIWRTIMKLPGNRRAFAGLNSKIPMGTTSSLLKHYKLADKSKASILALTVDRLVQLCPLLGQSAVLPEFVFPFLVVFQKDPLAAFEAVLTILSNYCQQWFEYHPFPPLNVLGIIENVLMEADPSLMKFYYDHGITSTQYAWPLLRTTMSQVLSANEWLVFWDHLLSYRKPSLLFMCVVAYSICSRETIFVLSERKEDFERFFREPGQVGVKEIMRVAHQLDQEISQKNHPSRYLRDKFCILPPQGPYPPILFGEYPKFLIDNESQTVLQRQFKDEDVILIEERRNAAKLAEEKRLTEETENFIKQIQQQRFREFQQCYEGQFGVTKMNFNRNKIQEPLSCPRKCSKSPEMISKSRKPCVKSKSQWRMSSCEKLRNDVRELEDEVETFMETMKSSK